MDHVFPKPLRTWLIVDVVLLNALVLIADPHNATFLYYALWLGGFGWFFTANRERIAQWLRSWNARQPLKFIVLGYAAVLAEELIVGFVHAASEGFALARFGELVLQFWAFNVLAFTGFIFGWYFLLRRYRYSATDLFVLVGIWGLFSEHTLSFFGANPVAAFLLILPTMCTYNLIIAPAIAGMPSMAGAERSRWFRYPFSLLVLFLLSVIPVLVLGVLRAHFPGAFPPCAYIAC